MSDIEEYIVVQSDLICHARGAFPWQVSRSARAPGGCETGEDIAPSPVCLSMPDTSGETWGSTGFSGRIREYIAGYGDSEQAIEEPVAPDRPDNKGPDCHHAEDDQQVL